jgi:hypothetical protein
MFSSVGENVVYVSLLWLKLYERLLIFTQSFKRSVVTSLSVPRSTTVTLPTTTMPQADSMATKAVTSVHNRRCTTTACIKRTVHEVVKCSHSHNAYTTSLAQNCGLIYRRYTAIISTRLLSAGWTVAWQLLSYHFWMTTTAVRVGWCIEFSLL